MTRNRIITFALALTAALLAHWIWTSVGDAEPRIQSARSLAEWRASFEPDPNVCTGGIEFVRGNVEDRDPYDDGDPLAYASWYRDRETGQLSRCLVTINALYLWKLHEWSFFCSVIVHERLHFTSTWFDRHSENPDSLMYWKLTVGNLYWRCGPNHHRTVKG